MHHIFPKLFSFFPLFLERPVGLFDPFYKLVPVNIQEDFSGLSQKELDRAPKAVYSKTVFKFDTIAQKQNATDVITITNTGKTPLIIRKIDTNNLPAISYKMSSMTIEPNQSATLELTYKAQSRRGKQFSNFEVITNSPTNPVQVIKVEGFIKQ